MSYEYKDTIQDSVIDYYDHVLLCNEYTDKILDELDKVYAQAAKADEYEAKAKAFDEIKNNLHDAQSSIDRSGNRKEERDHAVAFFNGLVEMDILEVYERTERND